VIIRIGRLRWAGYVTRMEEISMPRRLMYMQTGGPRKVGRLLGRRRDDVAKAARMLGIRSWWATAMNREEWEKCVKEAKTLYGL
jgi:hypothetical protein